MTTIPISLEKAEQEIERLKTKVRHQKKQIDELNEALRKIHELTDMCPTDDW